MALAARGTRNLDRGEERVADEEEAARLRRQAAWIHLQSLAAAAFLSAVMLLLPR